MTALVQKPVVACQHALTRIRGLSKRRGVLHALLLCLGTAIVFCAIGSAFGQQDFIDRQYQIKAAYLYNFAKYVQWPAETVPAAVGKRPAFVIAFVGEDPFGQSLAAVARRKTVRGKSILIRHIVTAEDYEPSHILFVPAGQSRELVAQILEKAKRRPTLIVGETKGFAQNSGHLNFYIESNKVKFEINRDAVARTSMKISSKLYHIARIVHDNPR